MGDSSRGTVYVSRERDQRFHGHKHRQGMVRKKGNLKLDMSDKVQGHFDKMRVVFTGFTSAPIFALEAHEKPDELPRVVGVLNAHWAESRFFKEPQLAEDFMVLTSPFRMLLERVLEYIQQDPSLLDAIIVSRSASSSAYDGHTRVNTGKPTQLPDLTSPTRKTAEE